MIDGASTPHRAAPLAGAAPREISSPVLDVRLWLVDLDGPDDEDAQAWISPSEKARASRFRFERDAKRYRIGHAALRQLLYLHADVRPQSEFRIGRHGKPAAGSRPFNTSDSGGLLLVALGAVGCAAIGVDLELIRPMDDCFELARRHFTPDESTRLREAPAGEVVDRFLTVWTRKEACLKAIGFGLNLETATIEVGLDPLERAVTLPSGRDSATVRVHRIDAGAGALAALAIAEGREPARLG